MATIDRTSVDYSPCERLRRARGWSMCRLAGIADVTTAVVQDIEAGRVAGKRLSTLYLVARALGCSIADLVPAVCARPSEGGRIQKSTRVRQAGGEARKVAVRKMLVELMKSRGGVMRTCDVYAVMKERYGVAAYYVQERRRECGIEVVRVKGAGRGLDAWEWRWRPSAGPGV